MARITSYDGKTAIDIAMKDPKVINLLKIRDTDQNIELIEIGCRRIMRDKNKIQFEVLLNYIHLQNPSIKNLDIIVQIDSNQVVGIMPFNI